jgi:predicted GIY-YIG superfamily endonuclease
LYIGATNDLVRRVRECGTIFRGFINSYDVHMFGYYEQYESIESAITTGETNEKEGGSWT